MVESFDPPLPPLVSDSTWRLQKYFDLVKKQRQQDLTPPNEEEREMVSAAESRRLRPRSLSDRLAAALAPFSVKWGSPLDPPTPTVMVTIQAALQVEKENQAPEIELIAKAGRVLSGKTTPKELCKGQPELRQLLILIFDVFRYRDVIKEALNGILFFCDYPQYEPFESVIHLLVYSFYCRHFVPAPLLELILKNRHYVGHEPIPTLDQLIESLRIKLAAEFSRIRIRSQVLSLSELLPSWLSEERLMKARKESITCWFNLSEDEEIEVLCRQIGLRRRRPVGYELGLTDFAIDPICPGCVQMHPCHRQKLLSSTNYFKRVILQERSLCLGPASLAVILSELAPLPGAVVVTHALANPQINYLRFLMSSLTTPPACLHIFNCSEAFTFADEETPQVTLHQTSWREAVLKELAICSKTFTPEDPPWVAVLAVPPNSCSACKDPVSLACTRGGDIALLETLAAAGSQIGNENEENNRIKTLLEEQRETLRLAMMIPTVQAVLYSTHSALSVENQDMVTRMLNESNQLAAVRHQEEIRKQQIGVSGEIEESQPRTALVSLIPQAPGELLSLDEVPDCDLFHTVPLSGKTSVEDDGCFLSLMIRKEVVRFDSQYMIKMAESRGLFGTTGRGKSTKTKAKREKTVKVEKKIVRQKRRTSRIDISRIMAPTLSSINRTHEPFECSRHNHHLEQSYCSPSWCPGPARRWWKSATDAVSSTLRQQKVIQTMQMQNDKQKRPYTWPKNCKIVLPRHRGYCCSGRSLLNMSKNSINYPDD